MEEYPKVIDVNGQKITVASPEEAAKWLDAPEEPPDPILTTKDEDKRAKVVAKEEAAAEREATRPHLGAKKK